MDLLYPVLTFIMKHEYPSILGFPYWPSLPIIPLLVDKDRKWKPFIKDVFRVPKGEVFLIPGSNGSAFFKDPFLKSDFYFYVYFNCYLVCAFFCISIKLRVSFNKVLIIYIKCWFLFSVLRTFARFILFGVKRFQ